MVVHPARVMELNEREENPRGKYVLLWVQACQRVRENLGLVWAIGRANALGLPVVACFGLMDGANGYPEANARHYAFLLEGLADLAAGLEKMGVKFVCQRGAPAEVALAYGKKARVIVCDRGYLRHQKLWREQLADGAGCRVVQVEGEVVVPVDVVSEKHEYAARTIRPRVMKRLEEYLVATRLPRVEQSSLQLRMAGDVDVSDPAAALKRMKVDRSVAPSTVFKGGEHEAARRLAAFVRKKLPGYQAGRNEPADDFHSHLSMYLHFGQISPVAVALAARDSEAPKADVDAFIEELIVRRELSMNFCEFVRDYDTYAAAVPDWARKSLAKHARDPRPAEYTLAELEAGKTGDPYWNAAQLEMVRTGFMHNYMRMYWGKKILEWAPSPEKAFAWCLALNNKYELDGRDANSFANIAWLFGTHDRPWGPERKVFGLVRYMNAAGLERKFDMDRYVNWVSRL